MAKGLSSEKKTHRLDMTSGPILAGLVRFSVPLVLSGALQLLFNAADIVVVGRFAGDNSLAAVGSTSSLINLLVNLFVGLSVGTNVVAANFFGAGKKKELRETIRTAMVVSVASGLVLTTAGVVGAEAVLRLMKAPPEVLDLAALYLRVYFAGMTATMVYNFGSALLRAKGDTKRPMCYLLFAGTINVALNLVFVVVLGMDVAGVALATVISQLVSAFLVVRCLVTENDDFRLELSRLRVDHNILIKIVRIGVPAGLQGIVFSLSNVVIQSATNSFGPAVIAGSSAASSIEGFVYTSMNGFSQGTLTFASQNTGARRYGRIARAELVSLACVLCTGLALGLSAVGFGPTLLGIYTRSPDVTAAGMERLRIIGTTFALCGMMDVTASAIRGMGHSLAPAVITLAGACGIRLMWLGTVFRAERFHTMQVLYLSYPVSWAVTLAALLAAFAISIRKATGRSSL